jgi:DNA-binding NtrC family response regulator
MNARVIAATNRDMMKEVVAGKFREDLYYRLNVVSINVPPLRERKEDIPLIVKHLLQQINEELHTKVFKISDDAMEKILKHDWPGNVRELQNILTRAVVLSKTDILEESVIMDISRTPPSSIPYNWNRTLEQVEREHIERVLKAVKGNRTEAAKILGISKPTLYARIPASTKEEQEKNYSEK